MRDKKRLQHLAMIFRTLSDGNSRMVCLVFLVFVLGVLGHVSSADLLPVVSNDEVQILDQGRRFFQDSDWGFTLHPDGRAFFTPFFVGPALVWIWTTIFNYSYVATKLFGLTESLLLAATVFLALNTWGTRRSTALISACFLWVDPVIVSSFRQVRLDALALAVALLGVTLLSPRIGLNSFLRGVAFGTVAALATLIWPTAAIGLLGAAIVLVHFTREKHSRSLLIFFGSVLLGCLIVTLLWLLVLGFDSAQRSWETFRCHAVSAPERLTPISGSVFEITYRAYMRAPWHFALPVLFGFLINTRFAILIWINVFITAGLLVTLTPPFYIWRLIYLLPSVFALVPAAIEARRPLVKLVLTATAMTGLITIGGRAYLARTERSELSYHRFMDEMREALPRGATVVGPPSIFYIGVKKQWKMYRLQDLELLLDTQEMDAFYLIVPQGVSPPKLTSHEMTTVPSQLPNLPSKYRCSIFYAKKL